jgi:hypothetical protein
MNNTLSDLTHAEARKHAAEQRLIRAIKAIEEAIQGGAECLHTELMDDYNEARWALLRIEGKS